MKSAGAVLPPSSASGSAGPIRGIGSRAADRRRKASRRDKARKASSASGGGAGESAEDDEYRAEVRLDSLEGVADTSAGGDGGEDDDYNEFEDLDDDSDSDGGKRKRRGKKKAGGNKRGRKGAGGTSTGGEAKYLKARSLASILIEEASRSDSVALSYVNASVRSTVPGVTYSTAESGDGGAERMTVTNPRPARKFCPVTGLLGTYTDSKTGIPYSSLSALEQIRERPPPWMNASGSAAYHEAVKSLRNSA